MLPKESELISTLNKEKVKTEQEIVKFQEEIDFYKEQGMEDICEMMEGFVKEKNLLLTETNHSIFKLKDALDKVYCIIEKIDDHRKKVGEFKESIAEKPDKGFNYKNF